MSTRMGHVIRQHREAAKVSRRNLAVAFRLIEWPWEEKGPLSLVPQPSEVTARAGRSELRLGFALPNSASVISPPSHSSTGSVRFTLSLTTPALASLEAARDGGPLELVMTLIAYPFVIAQYQGYAPGVGIQPTFGIDPVLWTPSERWIGCPQCKMPRRKTCGRRLI